ncbi:MAG: DUF4143 domain-containing protein [Melioribacteraceae bacterium]|nr:DUF4143 domain-containing protein [Melioribacteraceae bacterium]
MEKQRWFDSYCIKRNCRGIIARQTGWLLLMQFGYHSSGKLRALSTEANEQQSAILVIDEVQKVENWSEQVKKEWDRDRAGEVDLQVILLGSSRLLLQRGLTESLAGRYESTYMGHWSYPEMNSAFGLSADEFVWFGGYPGSAALIDDESRWKQYVRDSLIETTVSKDILMMTRVDKPALMKQLFELGCEFSGQILSYNKMLGQLHDAGNTTTLSHYLHLLDTAGLLAGLDKFSPNKIRQRASSPKLQVHNTALMSAQYPESFEKLKGRPAEWGRWVESAVGAHLLNATLNSDLELMYWRHSNDEVDFVLQKGEQVIGIEVKSGSGKTNRWYAGIFKKIQPRKSTARRR